MCVQYNIMEEKQTVIMITVKFSKGGGRKQLIIVNTIGGTQ